MTKTRLCLLLVLLSGVFPAGAQTRPVVRAPEPRTGIVVSVGDFLTGGASHYQAFKAAIASARSRNAARLIVPAGRYVFSDPELPANYAHLLLAGLRDLEIDGQGSELVFTDHAVQGIILADVQRVVLRNLSIEYSGTLASAGIVEKLVDGRTAIRFLDEFPAGPQTGFDAVSEFDIAARRWKGSANEAWNVRNAELVAPQTFVAPAFDRFDDGDEVVIRHKVYGSNAVAGFNKELHDVALEDVTVYSAPGMAFYFSSTGPGIRLTRCVVRTKDDRLISTTADGAHFTNTGGQVIVEDCDFSGQGDDSLNIGAHWLEPGAQFDARSLELVFAIRSRFLPDCVSEGMELVFHERATLAEHARRRVVSVTQDAAARTYRVVLDEPLAIDRPLLVSREGMDSGGYLVRNNRFHDHRARGMLLQAPRGRVENNVVSNPTMACLKVTADAATFFEGFGARDLVISGNRFEGCNYAGERLGSGARVAAVTIGAEVSSGLASAPVHSGVVFEDNVINDTPGFAMLIASAHDVFVRRNTIVDALPQPNPLNLFAIEPLCSVVVAHASAVTISGLSQQKMGMPITGGICIDPDTTSQVVVGSPRRRAVGSGH